MHGISLYELFLHLELLCPEDPNALAHRAVFHFEDQRIPSVGINLLKTFQRWHFNDDMHLGNFSTETNVNVKKWHSVSLYMEFYKMGQRTMGSHQRFSAKFWHQNVLAIEIFCILFVVVVTTFMHVLKLRCRPCFVDLQEYILEDGRVKWDLILTIPHQL